MNGKGGANGNSLNIQVWRYCDSGAGIGYHGWAWNAAVQHEPVDMEQIIFAEVNGGEGESFGSSG
jgi:hypothetical protein